MNVKEERRWLALAEIANVKRKATSTKKTNNFNRLVFFLNGPKAVPGACVWETLTGARGCWVAVVARAKIPLDTYENADPKVSQDKKGCNKTAILPLEIDNELKV